MNVMIKKNHMRYTFINPKIEIELNLDTLTYILKINSAKFVLDHINSTYNELCIYLMNHKCISLCIKDNVLTEIYPNVRWLDI
jgi:hypothetical protein